ncbi:MAG: TetR/AcrR family transcriptional regulator [Asticcacaulis sp.]|uniref:TetR/AcrR family transcriptional regulator n=1 Tax=Asticcacaulis sp. TaxID=1872648 RepID=UPI0039E5FE11
MSSPTPHMQRRTQEERSSEMKDRLLKAALEGLAEDGYAATSTQEVVKRAGVSRGALVHHFPTKVDLFAEAAAYLISRRIHKTRQMVASLDGQDDELEKRLRLLWQNYREDFPANIEFMIAARTDRPLRERFDERLEDYLPSEPTEGAPEISRRYLGADPSPLLTEYMIGCFIRGLCLEEIVNDQKLAEQVFEKFVRVLALALKGFDSEA